MEKPDKPLNNEERYLHAIVMRLDALCNMLSSFVETYAEQQGVALTNNKAEEKPKSTGRKTKKKQVD